MNALASATDFSRAFAQMRERLPGAAAPAVNALRQHAIGRFARHGLPGPRNESWKFTNLGPLAKIAFSGPVAGLELSRDIVAAARIPGADLAVFVNGQLRPELSDFNRLPDGATLVGLGHSLTSASANAIANLRGFDTGPAESLIALNAAFMTDGAVLRIGAGVKLDRPIQFAHFALPGAAPPVLHPRHVIVAEAGAAATAIETFAAAGKGAYWTNVVTEMRVGPGASLRHYKLQAEDTAAYHVAATDVRLERDAQFASFVLSRGGALARNEIDVRFGAEGARCRLDGLCLARGRQHIDHTTRIDHAVGHGTSHQVYKNVVDDHGHAVFQGRIRVAPNAQKTDAQQINRSLILTDGAQVDAKPELEILNDDVKCSHGASIGDLDAEQVFYLRARGLDERMARALLIDAFAAETVEAIAEAPVAEHFRAAIAAWLAQAEAR